MKKIKFENLLDFLKHLEKNETNIVFDKYTEAFLMDYKYKQSTNIIHKDTICEFFKKINEYKDKFINFSILLKDFEKINRDNIKKIIKKDSFFFYGDPYSNNNKIIFIEPKIINETYENYDPVKFVSEESYENHKINCCFDNVFIFSILCFCKFSLKDANIFFNLKLVLEKDFLFEDIFQFYFFLNQMDIETKDFPYIKRKNTFEEQIKESEKILKTNLKISLCNCKIASERDRTFFLIKDSLLKNNSCGFILNENNQKKIINFIPINKKIIEVSLPKFEERAKSINYFLKNKNIIKKNFKIKSIKHIDNFVKNNFSNLSYFLEQLEKENYFFYDNYAEKNDIKVIFNLKSNINLDKTNFIRYFNVESGVEKIFTKDEYKNLIKEEKIIFEI